MRTSTAIALFFGIGAALYLGRANASGMAKAVRLIKETEGLSLKPYVDQGGTWHIGYGHSLPGKPSNSYQITEAEAERLLRQDVEKAARSVVRLVNVPLDKGEQAALISFVYNLGTGALANSTLLRKLNQGNRQGAAQEFQRWIYVDGQPSQGLRTRREAEKRIFAG